MAEAFTGFRPAAFQWFAELESNNTRDFFAESRAIWEQEVRGPLTALLGELLDDFPGAIHLYRPYRDIRFSQDKSPLKTNASGLIQSRPGTDSSLYVEVSSKGLFAATGWYHWAKDQLARYRAAVQDERTGSELAEILAELSARQIETIGERLAGVPRGVQRDYPRLHLLQYKELYVGKRLPAEHCTTAKSQVAHVRDTWNAAEDLNRWFDQHVGRTPPAQFAFERTRQARGGLAGRCEPDSASVRSDANRAASR